MNTSYSVTIVIPTSGGDSPGLRACMASVFSQRPLPQDVLVVENGKLASGIRGLQAEFGPRLRAAHEPRAGVHHARNRGIALARGAIVVFLDDDVRPEAGWLASLTEACAEPGALAAGGPLRPEWESPPPAWLTASACAMGTLGLLDLGRERRDLDARREFLVGGNLACRRSAVLGAGGFQDIWPYPGLKTGTLADDYELSRRLARAGRVVYEPRAAVRHVIPARKLGWGHVLRRVYAQEAARTVLGGRLSPRRGPRELLGPAGLISAAVLLGHFRGRLGRAAPQTGC